VVQVSSTRRPAPPPLEASDQAVILGITVGWVIALIVLLAMWSQLPSSDRWWIWTCAAGIGSGLFGLWYVPRLKRSRQRTAERRAAQTAAVPGAGEYRSGADD
jgi:hypothetical protein